MQQTVTAARRKRLSNELKIKNKMKRDEKTDIAIAMIVSNVGKARNQATKNEEMTQYTRAVKIRKKNYRKK